MNNLSASDGNTLAFSVLEKLPPLGDIASLLFLVAVGIYIIFSVIIYYHWISYSIENTVSRITLIAYALCTLPLLFIMGGIILII